MKKFLSGLLVGILFIGAMVLVFIGRGRKYRNDAEKEVDSDTSARMEAIKSSDAARAEYTRERVLDLQTEAVYDLVESWSEKFGITT